VISAAGLGATVVVAILLALAAGAGLVRAIAVGFYVDGIALLVGCFVFGVRGPLRGVSREGDTVTVVGAKRIRRATEEERSESARIALILFALGIAVVILGSLIDPAHRTF
jgi:hypothetical protein